MGVEGEEGEVDKSEKSTIVEIRKLMFVKPEKRPANRQRLGLGWMADGQDRSLVSRSGLQVREVWVQKW